MLCHEFEAVFERHADTGLPQSAASHLESCSDCRAMVEDVELIRSSARDLALLPQEPSEHVWLNLKSRLREEGIIRDVQLEAEPVTGGDWASALFGWLRRPVLAGAYAALAIAAAGLIWLQPSATVEVQTAATIAAAPDISQSLDHVETAAIQNLHPADSEADASIARSIGVVDKFIAVCEKNVREHPRDLEAREYLNGAYQQKSDLLATAMQHGWPGE